MQIKVNTEFDVDNFVFHRVTGEKGLVTAVKATFDGVSTYVSYLISYGAGALVWTDSLEVEETKTVI